MEFHISGNNHIKRITLLLLLSYMFLMAGNGLLPLTNPDEVFYAQTAKEMAGRNSWMTPYLFDAPQFEKPVLLYWCLRIAFILFGVSSFSVRFFPALFASLGVLAVYLLGIVGFKNEKKAFIASLILMSCGLYVGLARTVFTDMIFSALILFSLAAFFWGYCLPRRKGPGTILFFVFAALAVLTKGPLGILIPGLAVCLFLFINKKFRFLSSKYFIWGIAVFCLVCLPWYIFMIRRYGAPFTHEFFYNDHIRRIFEAEHQRNDTWYFYPFSLIACSFPWSLYFAVGLFYLVKNLLSGKNRNNLYAFLACWIAAVFLIFEPAHSKLVSYIFPAFPAMALLAADFVGEAVLSGKNNRQFNAISLITAAILFLMPIGMLFALRKYPSYLSSLTPVYIFIPLYMTVPVLMLFFIIRNRPLVVTRLLAFVIPLFLLLISLALSDIKPYLSSKISGEYLSRMPDLHEPIMCSPFFVRGISYYTGKEVAVININGKNFFSPHPIPFLDSDQEVKDFLNGRTAVYCVVKKSALRDMARIAGKDFKLNMLQVFGNEYIVRIGRGG